MSITILEEDKELFAQIRNARGKGVIIVCTTHDEGSRTPISYPAAWKEKIPGLIMVTACDEYGRVLRDIDKDNYSYMIQGQNVAAGVIPFVESREYITGSSVSTALAAGLSSLILTCHEMARAWLPEGTMENGHQSGQAWTAESRLDIVKCHLDKMILKPPEASPDNKHVLLEKFGNIDRTIKGGEDVYADKVLRKEFRCPGHTK